MVLNLVPLSWLNVYHFSYLAALTKGNLKLKVLMKYFQGATRRAFENMSASHSCNFGCNFVDIHIYISTFYQWCNFVNMHFNISRWCNFVDIYISTFTRWAILSIYIHFNIYRLSNFVNIYISTFTGGAIHFNIYRWSNFVDILTCISSTYRWCNFVVIHTYIAIFTGGAILSIYIDTCQTLTGGAILSIYISTFTGDLFWFVGLVGHKILFRSHYRREDSFTLPSPYPWCDVWTTE